MNLRIQTVLLITTLLQLFACSPGEDLPPPVIDKNGPSKRLLLISREPGADVVPDAINSRYALFTRDTVENSLTCWSDTTNRYYTRYFYDQAGRMVHFKEHIAPDNSTPTWTDREVTIVRPAANTYYLIWPTFTDTIRMHDLGSGRRQLRVTNSQEAASRFYFDLFFQNNNRPDSLYWLFDSYGASVRFSHNYDYNPAGRMVGSRMAWETVNSNLYDTVYAQISNRYTQYDNLFSLLKSFGGTDLDWLIYYRSRDQSIYLPFNRHLISDVASDLVLLQGGPVADIKTKHVSIYQSGATRVNLDLDLTVNCTADANMRPVQLELMDGSKLYERVHIRYY